MQGKEHAHAAERQGRPAKGTDQDTRLTMWRHAPKALSRESEGAGLEWELFPSYQPNCIPPSCLSASVVNPSPQ